MVFTLSRSIVIVPTTTISTAVTGVLSDEFPLQPNLKAFALQAVFLYGSGGTTVKAWIQTSLDAGVTWIDIANFAFTTSALRKVTAINPGIVAAAPATPTDGTLGDNLLVNGILGDRCRCKWTTTGTYAGATSLTITAVPR